MQSINKQLKEKDRKILLFIDNCSAHQIIELSNVKVLMLPAHTTSVCQPLGQGVIRVFKRYYRKNLLHSVIAKCASASSSSKIVESVSVLDAIMWIADSWNAVAPATILNSFKKSGFHYMATADEDYEDEDDLSLQVLIDQARDANIVTDIVIEREILMFDNAIEIAPARTIEDIALESSESNEEQPREEVETEVSDQEALLILAKLKSYALQNAINCVQLLSSSENMINKFIIKKRQMANQNPLDSYFGAY